MGRQGEKDGVVWGALAGGVGWGADAWTGVAGRGMYDDAFDATYFDRGYS